MRQFRIAPTVHLFLAIAILLLVSASAVGETVILSDDFNNGPNGSVIKGRQLNNALGGSRTLTYVSPDSGSVIASHPNNGTLAVKGSYRWNPGADPGLTLGKTYRYDIVFGPLQNGDWCFLGVEKNVANQNDWGSGAVLMTCYNWIQLWFDSTEINVDGSHTEIGPQRGVMSVSAADLDSNGNMPIGIAYKAVSRTADSTFDGIVYTNNVARATFHAPLKPTAHAVGFGGISSGLFWVDNFKVVEDVVTPTPTPSPIPTPIPTAVPTPPTRGDFPPEALANVKDYTYMWWTYGWRDSRKMFSIQTSVYAMCFDYNQLALRVLKPLENPLGEKEALLQDNDPLFGDLQVPASSIDRQPLNNALGGNVQTKWWSPEGAAYAVHTTSSQMACLGTYNCSLVDYDLDPAKNYSYEIKMDPNEGESFFGGAALLRDPAHNDFWGPNGLMVRIFGTYSGHPGYDIFYGNGTDRIWPGGGTINPATDIDASGFFPLRVKFTGAGTAAKPFSADFFMNGNKRSSLSGITDLQGGARVGFAMPLGGYLDDVKLSETNGTTSTTLFSDDFSQKGDEPTMLIMTLEAGGTRYETKGVSGSAMDCQLVETGKYLQRRYLTKIQWAPGAPAASTNLEVVAWPDRISFLLDVTPSSAVSQGALEMAFSLPPEFTDILTQGTGIGAQDASGKGYVVMAADSSTSISYVSAARKIVVRLAAGTWNANTMKTVGIVIYPVVSKCGEALASATHSEESPLVVNGWQIAPVANVIPVAYDRSRGWYRAVLRNDGDIGYYTNRTNNRIERVIFQIKNPEAEPRTVHMEFAKERATGGFFGPTGISLFIRDMDRNPTGLPVQISKNWHGEGTNRYDGPWLHPVTMLTVPPNSETNFELTSIFAHYGNVPAASHGQLCLIGYGGNQQWDQSAIGSWGESICYDPDINLGRSMIDDVRCVMVAKAPQGPWGWTTNVGGGDYLAYWDAEGIRQWNSRMKTRFYRQCPNLTEVSYGGKSHDDSSEFTVTTSLNRTDDYVRGVYHMRVDVKDTVNFSRLAFLQIGADNYNDHRYKKMAIGDINGLREQWDVVRGGWSYSRTGIAMTGRIPWVSMHEAYPLANEAYANKGIVIRSWDARLGGAAAPTPYVSVYGTGDAGTGSAQAELSVPPNVTQLQAGDYAEFVVEHVIVPHFAAEYYGPNAALKTALGKYENTWQMIKREAAGNDIGVVATVGTVERAFPARIRANTAGQADFTISGGLGYVPVTICGLSGYRSPVLERFNVSTWTVVDQSYHGKDFWQTDYDAAAKKWEITYTLPLDTPNDARQPVQFRFSVRPSNPTAVNEEWMSTD